MHYTLWQWLLFFYIYGFFGWIWESSYASIEQHHPVNRGFLHGPLIPIYGFGALGVLLSTIDVRNSVVLIFIFGMAGATVLEYVTGWGMEKLFHVKYWDYSHFKFNLNGYICLLASLGWGFFSVLMVRVIHVPIEAFVLSLKTAFGEGAVVLLTAVTAVDAYQSLGEALDLRDMLEKLEESKAYIQKMQRRLEIASAVRFEDYKNFRKKTEAELSSHKERFLENLHAARAVKEKQLDEIWTKAAEKLVSSGLAEREDLIRIKQDIRTELQKLGARRDRDFKRVASLLSRNPRAVSKKYQDAMRELKELMK